MWMLTWLKWAMYYGRRQDEEKQDVEDDFLTLIDLAQVVGRKFAFSSSYVYEFYI